MDTFNPTYLYIKQHIITGLKYFGKTTKSDPYNYLGSGKIWIRHIKKHGKQHVKTIWVSELFYNKNDLINFALDFSKKNNIVDSSEWANLKEENGLDGGILPKQSLNNISKLLTGRTKETHDYIKESSLKKSKTMKDPNGKYQTEGRKKINQWLNSLTEYDRKEKLGHTVTQKQKEKLSRDRTGKTKENCERVKKMSETKKEYYSSLTEEEKKEKLGHSKGSHWYHNDELRLCKTFKPNNVAAGWIRGKKKYEN